VVAHQNRNVRENACFLAGIQRVVDRFLDGGEQCLCRAIKAQQMAVEEELRNGDFALSARHLGGGGRRWLPRHGS
jgi:hypothetical protein